MHVPDCDRHKLEPKSIKCLFVGYCETTKAYRLWDPVDRRLKISRDVIFNESPAHDVSTHHDSLKSSHPADEYLNPSDQITATGPRHSSRTPQPKKLWAEFASTVKPDLTTPTIEPSSFKLAMASPDSDKWKIAMDEEYQSLMDNHTWSLVPLPHGRSAIGCRWTYKLKHGSDGTIQRYKARFVAKGYSQRPGLDFTETYAPVVKLDSLRAILSIAANRDLDMIQLDVKTAFLYGEVAEELYISQPEGFIVDGQESLVCRLHKGLYGLKQSSRLWNLTFDSFLTSFGFISSSADPCVYFRENASEFTIFALWVDDCLLCSTSSSVNTAILSHLTSHFSMTSGSADLFIGLQISRDRAQRKLLLSQPQYLQRIIERFHMTNSNPFSTPADPNARLDSSMSPSTPDGIKAMNTTPYSEAIGCLTYAAVCTRPDIAFAVGQAARFCQNPGKAHWSAVKRILSYLAGTTTHGLLFSGKGRTTLVGYTDSDYAGDKDTRRSTSGFIFLHLGGAISWGSTRQSCTALSTTEAEYIAASNATKEAIWVQRLLLQIGRLQPGPVRLLCDNQSRSSPTHETHRREISLHQRETIRWRHRCSLHPNRPSTRRYIHEANCYPSFQLSPRPHRHGFLCHHLIYTIFFFFLLSILIS